MQASELAAALESAKSAKAEAQKALQEIGDMKKIAAGKAFIMQSKHVKVNYLLLTRVRSSLGALADLPCSASDAPPYYRAKEGSSIEKIEAEKTFIMHSKHVEETFHLLNGKRSSPGACADLPCSISDAMEFYRAEEGSTTKKLFWSQYAGTKHPMPLSDQLKQLVELHKAA